MKITYCPPGPDFGNQPCRQTGKTPDPWKEISDKPMPERQLFQAVIMQALRDLDTRSQTAEADLNQSLAHHWFTDNGVDFRFICRHAQLMPERVMRWAALVEGGVRVKMPKL